RSLERLWDILQASTWSQFDSEFGPNTWGTEVLLIGYWRAALAIGAARALRVPAAMQRHRSIATFQKPGQDFRLGERCKRGRLFLDFRRVLMQQLVKRALFSPRTNERQIP